MLIDIILLMIKRKFSQPEESPHTKIIGPYVLKPKILNVCQMPHFSVRNTHRKLLKKFYWSGIFKNIKNFVWLCTSCINHKLHRIPPAPLQEIFIPSMPGALVSMVFHGPFCNGFHVLTFLGHFSKYMELFQISPTSQTVVDALTN